MAKINIIPSVKKYEDYSNPVSFVKLNCKDSLNAYQNSLLKKHLCKRTKNELQFIFDESLSEEGYNIEVLESGVRCFYKTEKGKHNAILTLKQLLDKKENLTTCHIFDEPNFSMRSIMIDISRNKVLNLKTLKHIVDKLALVKINDLQLYVEGRSFYFESFPQFYENKDDFLNGEEVLELTKYAKERGIELTPNLNCFGHMAFWLNQPELNHLAFSPKGFHWKNNRAKNYPQTINPYNSDAKKLAFDIIDDMLKYYPDSEYCNIGGDEPFELLAPERHPRAKEIYEEHLKDVIDHVHQNGKKVMMWGDVIREYPQMLDLFGDVTVLDWCYEAKWVDEKRMAFYEEYKVPFIVCPGVGGWNSFSGKMQNMFGNIDAYAKLGKKYGASGMILTDWNDGGSFCQLVTSILAYVYGACYSWNDENIDFEVINKYIDENIYHNNIAQKVIDLGNYYLQQEPSKYSFSKLFNAFFSHQTDGLNFDIGSYSDCAALNTKSDILNYDECERIRKYITDWNSDLNIVKENDYTKELVFVYKLITHSLLLNETYLNLRDFNAGKKEVEVLLKEVNELLAEYPKIWNRRNKLSDFKYSHFRLKLLKIKYENLLRIYNSIETL